ncbi:MAG: ATP synthase F0 subunit C [Pseudobdellovibrionaceae bacterium]
MKNFAKKMFFALASTLVASVAFAQEAAAAATTAEGRGLIALGAGLAIGVAALGGALGQARTAASALEGIARNPAAQGKIFTPMIIGLALIESLVIYAFVIAFFLNGKI